MTPENGYPVVPYNAEFKNAQGDRKDETFKAIMEDIETLIKLDDVRSFLDENF